MRLSAAILLCCLGTALAQYGDDGPTPPKKPLQIPGARRVKVAPVGGQRPPSPPTQTTAINQRFRRPIPINRPRPSSEPIPELPVFTSGIRGSRPSSAAVAIHHEQNDDAAALPIQQHTQLVHAQQYQPQLQIQQHKSEVKPVSEVHEKDEDVVQVIANLGAVSSYGAPSNLLTPTASSPTPAAPTSSVYLQQERAERLQQERLQQQDRQERQQERFQQQDRLERQQDRVQQQERQERQQERQDRQQERQDRQQERQDRQQERFQQQVQGIQYRPPQQIARSSQNVEQQIHQVITPVQYRPQKPIRLQKQQQLVERNEYDINEARPVVKQRAQVAPKKSKPQGDYYDGKPKKPVAQVIRRYREETADGSIIWGFENDDGSFKEEMIGIDCITRGKYGYVDPDGVRREYTYETGIKCDEEAQQQQDQDILNTFVDYQENKLVLPSGKTIDLSSMGKKQARRPSLYRN